MATFDTVHAEAHRRGNIRKAIKTIGFIGRRSEVTPPESLFQENGELVDLVADGFEYTGLVTTDGWNFEREDSNQETTSQGFMSPTREDLDTVSRSVSVNFQESRKRVLQEIFDGADYRSLEVGVNELVKHKPEAPTNAEWCLVVIAVDGPADNENLMGKVFPTVKASTVGGEQWGGDSEISREVSFRVYRDDVLGVPEIEIEGGSAFMAASEDLGWSQPAPTG